MSKKIQKQPRLYPQRQGDGKNVEIAGHDYRWLDKTTKIISVAAYSRRWDVLGQTHEIGSAKTEAEFLALAWQDSQTRGDWASGLGDGYDWTKYDKGGKS